MSNILKQVTIWCQTDGTTRTDQREIIFNAENLATRVTINFGLSTAKGMYKHCEILMGKDKTQKLINFQSTDDTVSFLLDNTTTKSGYMTIQPFATELLEDDLTKKKVYFAHIKLDVKKSLNIMNDDSQYTSSMLEDLVKKINVKAVNVATLDVEETPTVEITQALDGLTFDFELPKIGNTLDVKSVTATTLAPSEPATANVIREVDGLTFEFGLTKGDTGASIVSVEYDGNDIKFTKDDETIVNIVGGKSAITPIKGVNYFDGYTPIKGVDYFDGLDTYDYAVANGYVGTEINFNARLSEINKLANVPSDTNAEIVKVENKLRKYNVSVLTSPTLLSVPIISDTFNNLTGVLTRNVATINLSGTDFNGISVGTNRDIIYTIVISGAKIGTSFVDGQTILIDKNGTTMMEGSTADTTENIGTYALTTLGRIWISVPKGTYANITDARNALGTMPLTFQLATPAVSSYGTEYILDFSTKHNFKITTATTTSIAITFANLPTETNAIISASLLLDYAVGSTLSYPVSVVWQNGLAPSYTVGKKYVLLFTSYDNGTTWLGSIAGEW